MLNPIKRVWVPKKASTPLASSAPVAAPAAAPITEKYRNLLFDEMPQPETEEKNTDSIWAEFDTVHPPEIEQK